MNRRLRGTVGIALMVNFVFAFLASPAVAGGHKAEASNGLIHDIAVVTLPGS